MIFYELNTLHISFCLFIIYLLIHIRLKYFERKGKIKPSASKRSKGSLYLALVVLNICVPLGRVNAANAAVFVTTVICLIEGIDNLFDVYVEK